MKNTLLGPKVQQGDGDSESLLGQAKQPYGSIREVESPFVISTEYREKNFNQLLTLLENKLSAEGAQSQQPAINEIRFAYSNCALNIQYSIGVMFWLLFETLLIVSSVPAFTDLFKSPEFNGACKAFQYPSPLINSLGSSLLCLPVLICLNHSYWRYLDRIRDQDNSADSVFNIQYLSPVYVDKFSLWINDDEPTFYRFYIGLVVFPQLMLATFNCINTGGNSNKFVVSVLFLLGDLAQILTVVACHLTAMFQLVSWLRSYSRFEDTIKKDMLLWDSRQTNADQQFSLSCPLFDRWSNAGFSADHLNAENSILVNEGGIHTYYLKVNWMRWCLMQLESHQQVHSPGNQDIGVVVSIEDLNKEYPIFTRICSLSLDDVEQAKDLIVTKQGQIYTASGSLGIMRQINRGNEQDPNTREPLVMDDLRLVRKSQLVKIIDNMAPANSAKKASFHSSSLTFFGSIFSWFSSAVLCETEPLLDISPDYERQFLV